MRQLIGSYPVVRKLGEGGMGQIFLVRDPEDGSLWAAKKLKGDLSKSMFVQRFRREFRALKALDHPAIVQVREMEYSREIMFFLMEYIDGKSFDKVLAQPRQYNAEWITQVLQWIRYLCDPLDYIHSQRIVHRDIKPGNLMILGPDSDPPLKLLDFGVIQWLHSETITTSSHAFLGSLRYMAPEQMSTSTTDLRSDLYSLGVILYEAVTGRAPFAVDNPLLLMSMHQNAEPPPPRQFNLDIPDNLQNLMLSLLAKRPDDRPNSAKELGKWIDQILEGEEFVKPDPRGSIFMTGMLFCPDLSGREHEIQKINKLYSECKLGKTHVATINGTAGIGKSRLITQFKKSPDMAFRIVFHGEFLKNGIIHNGFYFALKKTQQIIKKRRIMQQDKTSSKFDQIDAQLDLLLSVLNNPPTKNDQPINLKIMAAQLLEVICNPVLGNPIVLILDDVHLAKPSDLTLLKHIIELHNMDEKQSRYQGLFIIISYRDNITLASNTLSDFLQWLDSNKYRTEIPLVGLNKIAVKSMVSSMFGGSYPPIAFTDLLRQSNGNPLHIIELVREYLEDQQDRKWAQTLADDVTFAAPGSKRITHMLGRRIDRFSENAQDVIRAGAILGGHFRADELERVCNIDDDRFLDQVDLLLRQRVIEEDPFQGETYRFTHRKLQEAIYNKIPLETALKIHSRAINVLEDIYSNDLRIVAERILSHCIECKLPDKIVDYHVLSSDYANSMGDQIEAKTHIEKGLKTLKTLKITDAEKNRRQIEIQTKYGSLLRRTGEVIKAERILVETLMSAAHINNRLAMAKVQKQLGSLWGAQGKINEAAEALNDALKIFEETGEDVDILDCYINLGASYNSVHLTDKNLYYQRLAMEKAQLLNDEHRLTMSLINIGISYATQRNGEKAFPYLNRALDICERINAPRLKAFALMTKASSYLSNTLFEDNIDKIIDLTSQVIEIAHKIGNTNLVLDCLYKKSIARNHKGEPVLDDLDKAIQLAHKLEQTKVATEIEQFREKVIIKNQKGEN